jgi:hypothetical protein
MRGLMMAAALLLLTAAAARAESCARSVDELSRRYALTAPAGGHADEPALSGSSMPPGGSPEPGAGGSAPATGSEADPRHLSAATRSEATALLQSALGADARGREDECLRRFREAQSVLEGG